VTAEMVGNWEWVVRVAMHAVPPHPTHPRRWHNGGGPPAFLPLLADIGEGAPDTLGVRAGRPRAPSTTKPPDTGPPVFFRPGLPFHVRGPGAQPGPDAAEPSETPWQVLPLTHH